MTASIETLEEVVKRAETWPKEAREQLASLALEIEAGLAPGFYEASAAELEGIDRGLKDARQGRIAGVADVEAVFSRYRKG